MPYKGSGTGQGGKSFQDRELAAQVRTLSLERIKGVLQVGRGPLYEAILIRLAGTVLPRLNENTGLNGGPMEVTVTGVEISVRK